MRTHAGLELTPTGPVAVFACRTENPHPSGTRKQSGHRVCIINLKAYLQLYNVAVELYVVMVLPSPFQSDWSFHRWRLMASRGWEVTTSLSRRVSKDHLRTSALHSRPLKARPRAPTCSPARRRYRYERTQAGQRSAS